MAIPIWPISRLILFITLLWMILAFHVLMGNCYGVKIFAPSLNSCTTHIAQYENQHQIPTGLLHAISKVESGRKDNIGRIVAWPWTVNAAGQGYYFPTKEAAISAVQNMQAQGIQSIDVGCMQVNLYHHPHAFKNLSNAFDPAKNVAYAARFLKALKNEHLSWHTAVAHYHSTNPVHHVPYQKTVLNVWNHDIKNGGISLAAGVFEAVASQSSFPTVNRIRRLTSVKTLSLEKARIIQSSYKGRVRRVTRGKSPHIHRI